jgi:hypothetical protein
MVNGIWLRVKSTRCVIMVKGIVAHNWVLHVSRAVALIRSGWTRRQAKLHAREQCLLDRLRGDTKQVTVHQITVRSCVSVHTPW